MTHKNEITADTKEQNELRPVPPNTPQYVIPVDEDGNRRLGSNVCVFNPVNNFSPTNVTNVYGPDIDNNVPVSDNRKSNPDISEVGNFVGGIAGIIGSLLSK